MVLLVNPTTKIRGGRVSDASATQVKIFKYIFKNIKLPSHRDPRVQIVELGSTEGNLLVLFTISRLHLQLHQLLLYPLNRLLLGLHSPEQDTGSTQGYKCGQQGRPGRQLFIYTKPLDTYFLDFSSLRTLASALALFSSLLASESWSLFASI